MKKKFSIFAFSALAVFGIGASSANSIGAIVAKAETVNISSLDDFKNVFNKGAAYCNADINLTADIDVSDYLASIPNGGSCGMAGEYSGTFNGNGHVISGIGTAEKTWGANTGALFNIVGSKGTIKNLVIDWTACRDNIGSLGYMNNGTCENVTVITRVPGGANSFGAFFAQNSGGTYKNCNSHFIITGGMGGAVGAVSFGGAPDGEHVKNCSFTRLTSGAGNTAAANNLQFFQNVSIDNIYANGEYSLTMGESVDLSLNTHGIPGTWECNTDIISVENGVVTAVESGDAVVTATMRDDYASIYGEKVATFNITVEAPSNVTGIEINEDSISVPESKTTTVSATLTGTDYNSINWSIDDETIASVEGNGTNAVITGLTAGNTSVKVEVLSTNGEKYTSSVNVEVTVFANIVNTIKPASNFKPLWEGAGLQGIVIDTTNIEGREFINNNSYKDHFNFEAKVTKKSTSSSANFSISGWQFDSQTGSSARLYVWFSGAPVDNTGWYSLDYTLTYENATGRYIYKASYMFDGKAFVETSGKISGDDALSSNSETTLTANFSYFSGSEYDWKVSDDTVLELTESNTDTVVVKGLKEGTATVTCTVVENETEYTVEHTITVSDVVADVTEIATDVETVSLKEGKSQNVTLTFIEGAAYETIKWESLDENVAIVVSEGKEAVITAKEVGNTKVVVTVVTASGSVEKEIAVTTIEADKMTMYLAIPNDFVNLGNSGYGLWLYGKVTGQAHVLADTGVDMLLDSKVASIYEVTINLDNLDIANENDILWMQICSATNSGARWGAGFNINDCYNNKTGALITCLDWSVGGTGLSILANENEVKEAFDFVKIRDDQNGICYLLNDQEKLSSLIEDYNSISDNTKAIVDSIYELNDYSFTFGDTMNYLMSLAHFAEEDTGNQMGMISSMLSNNNSYALVALMALGLVSVVAYYFINKKKFSR